MSGIFEYPGDPAADPDGSEVMTFAELKAAQPMRQIAIDAFVGLGVSDPNLVRVSRVVRSAEFRQSRPTPTAYFQGDTLGGQILILTKPFTHWEWMYHNSAEDVFAGAIDDMKPSWEATGLLLAVLAGSTNPANAQIRLGIA